MTYRSALCYRVQDSALSVSSISSCWEIRRLAERYVVLSSGTSSRWVVRRPARYTLILLSTMQDIIYPQNWLFLYESWGNLGPDRKFWDILHWNLMLPMTFDPDRKFWDILHWNLMLPMTFDPDRKSAWYSKVGRNSGIPTQPHVHPSLAHVHYKYHTFVNCWIHCKFFIWVVWRT
jgi:hypothetical protein